jgi:Na+-transporting NADH:ubiquinone oxidoreductase subunit D
MANKAVKEPLFSAKIKKTFKDPLVDNNPITVQVLGICSSLAVTAQLKPAILMSVAVIFVIAFANVIISFLRNMIPSKIRIIVELAVVATLVILVQELLKAFAFELSRTMGVFVGLIITNCIVMGRLEAFALGNKPWPSFIDGIGNGVGYGIILILIGAARELLGAGTLLGIQIIPDMAYSAGYTNNGLMLLAPGAFIILGLIIWAQRAKTGYVEH